MSEVLINNNPIKTPKKRGRKPKKKEDVNEKTIDIVESTGGEENKSNIGDNIPSPISTKSEEKVKKKRGRKPKNIIETTNSAKEDNIITVRRRGRKPKDKFNYETTNFSDYQNSIKRNENVIIKLPISCLKLENDYQLTKDLYQYNPNIEEPKPYDTGTTEYKHLNTKNRTLKHTTNNDSIQNNKISFDNNIDSNNIHDYQQTPDSSLLPTNDVQPPHSLHNYSNIETLSNDLPVSHIPSVNDDNDDDDDNNNNNLTINRQDINPLGTIFNPNNLSGLPNNNKSSLIQQFPHHIKKIDDTLLKETENIRQIDLILNKKYNYNQEKIEIMNGFVANSTVRVQKTDIACWWCCHEFDTVPWGIPTKYCDDKFDIFGVFCSPNCTLSHLLDTERDDDYLWEKVALLNLLYYKIYNKYETIIPSPNKISLIKFGGSLTIEEFHNLIDNNNKSYTIEFPPCNNVIPMLEEIYKKTNLTNTYIPVDKNRITKANNELKLKRNTPINNNKNTLDNCMNIKF